MCMFSMCVCVCAPRLVCVYLGLIPDVHHFSADSSIPPSLRLFTSLPQTALPCVPTSNFSPLPLLLSSPRCSLFTVFRAPIIPCVNYGHDFLSMNRNRALFPESSLSMRHLLFFLSDLSFPVNNGDGARYPPSGRLQYRLGPSSISSSSPSTHY